MQLGLFTTVRNPQPWLTCYDVGIYTVAVDGSMVMITNRATGREVIRFTLPAGVTVRDVVAVVEAGDDWQRWSVGDWFHKAGRR